MLVLEFVNAVNKIQDKQQLIDDETGEETITILNNCLKVSRLVNSNHPSSLGLHPAIYF